MHILNRQPLDPMFNCAVQTICKRVWPQWFDTSEHAPSSFKALRHEYMYRGRITVYSGGCDNTIFDDPDINVMFRAWHDWCHIYTDADFSPSGEYCAAQMQTRHVVTLYGNGVTGAQFCRIIDAEVNGQAAYYARYRKYIEDQRGFVSAYMVNKERALGREW